MLEPNGLQRDGLIWKIFDYFLTHKFKPSQMYLFQTYEDDSFNIDVDFFARENNSNKILLVQTVQDDSEQAYNWAKSKLEFVAEYFFQVPQNNSDLMPVLTKIVGDESNKLVGMTFPNYFKINSFMAYHSTDGSVGFFDLNQPYRDNKARLVEHKKQ